MCLFCKIVEKEIPANIIYEDANFLAFLDINPLSRGHTLLVSKKHFDNLLQADNETLEEILPIAKKVGNFLTKELNARGLNVLSNVGDMAGQSVYHFHMHLIPRYSKTLIEKGFQDEVKSDAKTVFPLLENKLK
jgi:histidine triad (HIT) family protein